MRADYSETEYSGGMLRWFTIDIDAEDIGLVRLLLEVVRKRVVEAVNEDRYADAKRMMDMSEALTLALKKAKG